MLQWYSESQFPTSAYIIVHKHVPMCVQPCIPPHRGDWSFPDGTQLPFSGPGVTIYLGRAAQIATIRRTSGGATGPTGIYRCDIPTVAVHNSDDSLRVSVYVGLYPANGGKLKHRLAADINV